LRLSDCWQQTLDFIERPQNGKAAPVLRNVRIPSLEKYFVEMFSCPCAIWSRSVYLAAMKTGLARFVCAILLASNGFAAPKAHVVTFGKWTTVKCQAGDNESKTVDVKVRPLYVDGRTKEFTLGPAHDVTDRTFVVQRMFRLNDSLPQETGAARWRWERCGWLQVDRVTGKVEQLTQPEFDSYDSAVNWFRDYGAYCGVSDDGQKVFAIILQLGRRKPLLKKALVEATASEMPGCPPPIWQRGPVRVTFEPKGDQKTTFAVRSRTVDLAAEDESEGEE